MYEQKGISEKDKSLAAANTGAQKMAVGESAFEFEDKRLGTVAQRKLQSLVNSVAFFGSEFEKEPPIQKVRLGFGSSSPRFQEQFTTNTGLLGNRLEVSRRLPKDRWIPTGGNPTRTDFENLLNGGAINANSLMKVIPAGLKNKFVPESRTTWGFKFEWGNWHVHGHEPDRGAVAGHAGGAGWVVRIRQNNDWLLANMQVSNFPLGHANYFAPRYWSRGRSAFVMRHSHIPLTL